MAAMLVLQASCFEGFWTCLPAVPPPLKLAGVEMPTAQEYTLIHLHLASSAL